MTFQIAVLGNDESENNEIPLRNLTLAEKVGRELARRGAIVLCGGRGGVMRAVAKGAIEEKGITVGILPSSSKKDTSNEYLKVVIPSGVGPVMRGSIIIRSSDGVITIGGGVGTLGEIACAYVYGKPIVGIRGTGGWTDKLIDTYIDERKLVKVIGANSPKEAVKIVIEQVEQIQQMELIE